MILLMKINTKRNEIREEICIKCNSKTNRLQLPYEFAQ